MKIILDKKIIIILCFCLCLAFFSIKNIATVTTIMDKKYDAKQIEETYTNNFFNKLEFVNLNGFVSKCFGQKVVNGTIKAKTKAKDDVLFLLDDTQFKFEKEKEIHFVQKAVNILNYGKKMGATTLYVQHPNKYNEKTIKLPYGLRIEYNKEYDYWLKYISKEKIDTIDLRKNQKACKFYKTDHHWTIESSFEAAKIIVKHLNKMGINELNPIIYEDEYNDYTQYGKTFLGSEGIRVGEYYGGMDSFNLPIPTIKTNFNYYHYIDGKIITQSKGEFKEAFIDERILQNDEYYNKYNACLYGGYVENILINNECNNDIKTLLISDSFSRPMAMYFSLAVHEIRYLDPQKGRYNDSLIKYIEEYSPDIIIMMYTGDFVTE